MKYKNLKELISSSKSARDYFLTLTVDTQLLMHCEYNDSVRSLEDLRIKTDMILKNEKQIEISNSLDRLFRTF